MSEFQLGRVGIVLLGLYILVKALLGAAQVGGRLIERGLTDVAVASALTSTLLVGLLPAVVLIANRTRFARWWFAESPSGAALSARDLLRVGLILIAIGGIWDGVVGLVSSGALFATIGLSSAAAEETAHSFASTLPMNTARAATSLVMGVLLLRFARPLSRFAS